MRPNENIGILENLVSVLTEIKQSLIAIERMLASLDTSRQNGDSGKNSTLKNLSGIITEASLLEILGPAPKISAVAKFIGESVPTTWRRVRNGQLQSLQGDGNIRVSLRSLVQFLNSARK